MELRLGPGATVRVLRRVERLRLHTVFAGGALGESHASDAFLSCQLEDGHAVCACIFWLVLFYGAVETVSVGITGKILTLTNHLLNLRLLYRLGY